MADDALDISPTLRARAAALDAADPLAAYTNHFLTPAGGDLVAYFDGNSLGRPLASVADALSNFVNDEWGCQLIRGWDDRWMELPTSLGDRLGRIVLGAAGGQTVIGDSTTVLLYKLARAAVDAQLATGRDEIVLDTDNFPTDRYVLEGIAAERGASLVWIETDPATGITPEQVAAVTGPSTALAVFSHVAYRSGWMADAPAITAAVHDSGALMLWDLSHSGGSVPLALDDWGVDLAVGCSYKYLNGGPGAPAYAYVATAHQDRLSQPIHGWMGRAEPFTMAPGYRPAPGVRSFVSGTPPVLGMIPLEGFLTVLDEVGLAAVRAKSLALTDFALEIIDEDLVPLGVALASPRDHDRRGGHLTLTSPGFAELTATLWRHGVIPDFRHPDGIRIGLSPLSTTFAEVATGLAALLASFSRP
ncbi:MAG: kynureninase [Nostocoides sp.]